MSVAVSQSEVALPAPRTDTLADTVVLLSALTVVQRLVGFARSVLFCRWLDPLELGEWDLAFGFLVMAAPLAVLGIPGTFGRYVEHYRQRGQLRAFLAKSAWLSALPAMLGIGLVVLAGEWFSQLVFGRPDRVSLILLMAGGLGIMIGYNFIIELLTGLRSFRIVSGLHFAHSLAFALIGVALLIGWQNSAASVVVAYATASLLCAMIAVFWLRPLWHSLPIPSERLPHRALVAKVLPFAAWAWISNWLTNMFDLVDRYMLVHYSGFDAARALSEVGNYHSSRIVPLLLVSVGILLANAVLPHMSHDWEAGRRTSVSQRVNLMLKLGGFVGLLGGAIILLAAPLLFDYAFQGKYSGGMTILPWTLTYCIWFGLLGIAQSYLWCAEKVRLGSVAVLVGLLVNIGLNFVLLPKLGLHGAVLSTAAANFVALALTCACGHLCGLRFDMGVWLIFLLPPLLAVGPWHLLAVLALFAAWAGWGEALLSQEDRRQLVDAGREYWSRLRGRKLAEW